jgi:hypothetical protein
MKPRDSSDAEIQALEVLCERLAGFDDRVSPEWLDGCMAALLAGPRALTPLAWLPRLLGDAWERTFADPQDVQQALDTLTTRWQVLASHLDAQALFDAPDELRLSPLLGDYGSEARNALVAEGKLSAEEAEDWPLTGELWALGVLETIQAFADDWVAPTEDDEDAAWYDGSLRAIEALRSATRRGWRPILRCATPASSSAATNWSTKPAWRCRICAATGWIMRRATRRGASSPARAATTPAPAAAAGSTRSAMAPPKARLELECAPS